MDENIKKTRKSNTHLIFRIIMSILVAYTLLFRQDLVTPLSLTLLGIVFSLKLFKDILKLTTRLLKEKENIN